MKNKLMLLCCCQSASVEGLGEGANPPDHLLFIKIFFSLPLGVYYSNVKSLTNGFNVLGEASFTVCKNPAHYRFQRCVILPLLVKYVLLVSHLA